VGGFGLSRDGRLVAYVALELTYFLERLTIDPASGETRDQPVQVIQTSRAIEGADTSPDGKLVVFDSQGSVQEDIFLAQADGTKVRHLTDDAARDRGPSFLPEGKRIVFQSDRGGNWDIWTILPDGSGLTQVTRSSTSATAPYPSPDGRRIAASDGADAFVFELDDKGGLARERKLPRLTGADVPYAAGWTPDSKKLLVSVTRNDGTVASLALFSLDSGSWETLPAPPGMTTYASVMAPDRLIAQTREGIVVGKLSGGPVRLLAAHPPNSTYTTSLLNRAGTVLTLVRIQENADIWTATSP
jgi:Tol biopolymer transport system component